MANKKWNRPPRPPMAPADKAKRSASVAAYWAAKRGAETPEARAKREAKRIYQLAWRNAQTKEWRAEKSARDMAWRERKKGEAGK